MAAVFMACLLALGCATAGATANDLAAQRRLCGACCGPSQAELDAANGRRPPRQTNRVAIAGATTLDTVLTNRTLAAEALLGMAGSHPWVWWNAGAGVLHLFDNEVLGFALAAAVGVRVQRDSIWSISFGAQFLNASQYYADEKARPAQHVLGQLGADVVAARSNAAEFRVSLRGLVGAQRKNVARIEGAREVVAERTVPEFGAAVGLSVWFGGTSLP